MRVSGLINIDHATIKYPIDCDFFKEFRNHLTVLQMLRDFLKRKPKPKQKHNMTQICA